MLYERESGEEKAEYAALVEDRWQGHGIGIDLTRRLVDVACGNGVRYLYGLVMRENRRMLHLLRDLELPEQECREEGVTRFEVCLQAE